MIWAELCGLLVWNVILSTELHSLRQQSSVETSMPNATPGANEVVTHTVNGYVSDITTAAASVRRSMVRMIIDGTESGSGIIYKQDGDTYYVLTSSGLVTNGTDIEVRLASGALVEGTVVGYDSISDAAVVTMVPGVECPVLSFGDSSLVKAGEYVIALGATSSATNSFPISFGVSGQPGQQVHSSNGRYGMIEMLETDMDYQTAMQGGALVNLSGELVGMISGTYGASVSAVGVNELQDVLEQLENNGTVTRGYFGAAVENVANLETYEKSSLNVALDLLEGVMVSSVAAQSPAEEAGMRTGDVILSSGDASFSDIEDLRRFLYTCVPMQTVTFNVQRGQDVVEVSVTLQ